MKLNNENVLTPTSSSSNHVAIPSQEGRDENILALDALIAAGGPQPVDYPFMDRLIETLYARVNDGLISKEEVRELKDLFNDEWLQNTVHGWALRKPMGYAGDFKIIDMIYTHHVNDHPSYKNWDNYFHQHAATRAVRNRKDFFKEAMHKKLNGSSHPVRLLNVASGPARDLLEVYENIDPCKLSTTCVDLDNRAIEHARALCKDYLNQITFVHKNILRFSTIEQFDVIWSAGLFDYFDDKTFVMMLKRFLTLLRPGGEIILGNFSEDNPSRGYMEVFGEWFLIHRSAEKLIALAFEAGVSQQNITVDREPLGVNLFLKVRN